MDIFDFARGIMENPLFQALIAAIVIATVAYLGYLAAKYRFKEKTAEHDVKREREDKELILAQKEVDLERVRIELRMQTERAENEKAIREAMMLSMRRVASLEDEQGKINERLRVTEAQYTEAKELIEDQQAQLIQRDRQSEARTKEIARQKEELHELQQRVSTDENERAKLLKIISEKEEVITAKNREIETRDARISEMERELREVRRELEELKQQIKSMEPPPPPDIQPATDEPPAA